jgi:hypothetical protein
LFIVSKSSNPVGSSTGFYGENCEFTGFENASLPDARRLSGASCNASEAGNKPHGGAKMGVYI